MRRLGILTLPLLGCGRVGFAVLADAPDPAPITSCTNVAATCGPGGNASCCDSAVVSGGTFYRSYDGAADMVFASMSWPATVSTFRLDTYEVTVGRFRQFVNTGMGTQMDPPIAGAGAHAAIANSGWDSSWNGSLAVDTAALVTDLVCDAAYASWTNAPAGNETRPIGCVTWFEAMAFCAWDGGFLPTEAESMYAASGGSLQRAYPWSSPPSDVTIDCQTTNFGGPSWPTSACVSGGSSNVGSLSPRGDGFWGQADLGGNVWEWALDWHGATLPLPCNDCANLVPDASRLCRGGSYFNVASNERAGDRNNNPPEYRTSNGGVRCARAP